MCIYFIIKLECDGYIKWFCRGCWFAYTTKKNKNLEIMNNFVFIMNPISQKSHLICIFVVNVSCVMPMIFGLIIVFYFILLLLVGEGVIIFDTVNDISTLYFDLGHFWVEKVIIIRLPDWNIQFFMITSDLVCTYMSYIVM